ncbi:MAG: hypothetical protein MJ016_07090 [Victivallaceae bacterium]|nr:hypothetical protein [Victivallaceae bacterium]
MMNQKSRRVFPLLVALILAAGCTVIRELPRDSSAEPETKECRKARVLLDAFLADDGKGFVAALPEEMQKSFTVERFRSTRAALVDASGHPKTFPYLTLLAIPHFHPSVWKISCERISENGSPRTAQVLFRVVTARDDQNNVVIRGFQFL